MWLEEMNFGKILPSFVGVSLCDVKSRELSSRRSVNASLGRYGKGGELLLLMKLRKLPTKLLKLCLDLKNCDLHQANEQSSSLGPTRRLRTQ